MAVNEVPNDTVRQGRTKAEFYRDFFGGLKILLGMAVVLGVVYFTAWGKQTAERAAYQTGKAIGYNAGYEEGVQAGIEQGREVGFEEGLGKARPLTVLGRYRFLAEHRFGKKRYGLLVPEGTLEPELYELDARQLPNGTPAPGGMLEPVGVVGYFKPINPTRPSGAKRSAMITRRSSRISAKDWPMCLTVNPKVFDN